MLILHFCSSAAQGSGNKQVGTQLGRGSPEDSHFRGTVFIRVTCIILKRTFNSIIRLFIWEVKKLVFRYKLKIKLKSEISSQLRARRHGQEAWGFPCLCQGALGKVWRMWASATGGPWETPPSTRFLPRGGRLKGRRVGAGWQLREAELPFCSISIYFSIAGSRPFMLLRQGPGS